MLCDRPYGPARHSDPSYPRWTRAGTLAATAASELTHLDERRQRFSPKQRRHKQYDRARLRYLKGSRVGSFMRVPQIAPQTECGRIAATRNGPGPTRLPGSSRSNLYRKGWRLAWQDGTQVQWFAWAAGSPEPTTYWEETDDIFDQPSKAWDEHGRSILYGASSPRREGGGNAFWGVILATVPSGVRINR